MYTRGKTPERCVFLFDFREKMKSRAPKMMTDFGKTSTHAGAEWRFSARVFERSIVNIAVSFTVTHLTL